MNSNEHGRGKIWIDIYFLNHSIKHIFLGSFPRLTGRALEWHSRGQRFDPAYLHQRKDREPKVPCLFLLQKSFARERTAVDVAAVCRQAEPQPTYNAKVCVANGRSAASIPLISTKGKASQNLDVQGLRGFFLLLLQGCKLEINGRKKKKYEQFFRTFFVQLHFIFSTYSFRPFATSCMRVWRICVYISLVVWILLCPISSCVAFSSTLAS